MPDINFDFSSLTLFDLIFIGILVISTIPAISRGFTLELVRLVGWPLCFVVSGQATPVVAEFVPEDIPMEGSRRFTPALYQDRSAGFDRWVGALYGLVRGLVIAMGIYGFAAYYADGDDNLPDAMTNAALAPVVQIGLHLFTNFLPDNLADEIEYNVQRPRATKDIEKSIERSAPESTELLDLDVEDYGY